MSEKSETLNEGERLVTRAVTAEENSGAAAIPPPKAPPTEFYNQIDAYIESQPAHVQPLLISVRKAIKQVLPDSTEKISYQMPTFWQGCNLIHFAAQKKHLGLYPGAEAVACFAPRLLAYQTSKGAIRFPYNSFGAAQLALITEIAAWCEARYTKK